MSGSNPYEWLQDLMAQVPELVQPFIVALAGAIPYIEGEGSAGLGVIAGINPVVAAVSGATGNIISVVLVVLLSSRARSATLARRERRAAERGAGQGAEQGEPTGRQSKGHKRLRRWLVRFGVPGTSLIGPLALPTQLTAATLVASGVSKSWVILWQVIAIVLWTTLITLAATGVLTAIEAA